MFLPTSRQEMDKLGWNRLDIILVTGDSYIDSPFIGIAVIGKVLLRAGYRVGIIAQPDVNTGEDIKRLGEPELFWGISGGSIDSMVANYTSTGKKRRSDDYTPGGKNNRRPDRAVIIYSNLIRRYYKQTKPLVLGGIEASLRRIAHYDFWSNRIRRSILFDAKSDILVYGMGEKTVLALARKLREGDSVENLPGICYIAKEKREEYIELPSFTEVAANKPSFIDMFHTFYRNSDPITARGMCQQQDTRFLIHNPPPPNPTQQELDNIYNLEFEGALHPYYRRHGTVKALETIKFSISTHRGCYGECNFCAIAIHEGRTVVWRSEESIIKEAKRLIQDPDFKGYIQDVGGPTANMYGFECHRKLTRGCCDDKRCLHPQVCPVLKIDHGKQTALLKKLRKLEGIKKVFVASGIRHDMVLSDKKSGDQYLREIVNHHVSGQMKVAPEHSETRVLDLLGKPDRKTLRNFREKFNQMSREAGKKQYLTYYFIAAHPGCDEKDMVNLKVFTSRDLKINPEQVQIFTPLPSTYSALMYYTEQNPFTGEKIFVEKSIAKKLAQKGIVVAKKGSKDIKNRRFKRKES